MRERLIRTDIADKKYKNILLISYCFMAAIVVSIVLVGVVSTFNNYMKQMISDMTQVQLSNYENSIEHSLDNARIQLQTAKDEPAIIRYLYAQDSDEIEEYNISRFMQKVCVNSDMMEAVILLRHTGDIKRFGQRYLTEAELAEIGAKIRETTDDEGFCQLDQDTIGIYLTERSCLGGAPENGIIGVLSLEKLKEEINASENTDQYYMITDSHCDLILSNGLPKEDCIDIQQSVKEQGSTEYKWKEQLYLINYKWSADGQYCIYILQNYEENQAFLIGMKKTLYISILIASIGVLLISLWLTNFIYAPVARFFTTVNQEIQTSAMGEQQIKNQVEITSEKILNHINVISQKYQENKIISYLEASDEQPIPIELSLMGGEEQCLLILLRAQEGEMIEENTTNIGGELENLFQGCKVRCVEDEKNQSILVIIKEFCRRNSLAERIYVKEKLESYLTRKELTVGRKHSCAVSTLCKTEKQIKTEYNDLKKIYKYAILEQQEQICFTEMFADKCKEEIDRTLFEPLISSIQKEDREQIPAHIQEILQQIRAYDIQKILWFLTDMCMQMRQRGYGADMTGQVKQYQYFDYYMKLNSIKSKEELLNFLQESIEEVFQERETMGEKTIRIRIIDAVSYLNEHYRESDISVERVAEESKLSVSYFSKLFNDYVGMTFPEYVNDLRLTYAYNMILEHQTLSIKKIAESCGFQSMSYFSAQFKKKFGITPSSVRS